MKIGRFGPVAALILGVLSLVLGVYLQLSHGGAPAVSQKNKAQLAVSATIGGASAYIDGQGPYALPHTEYVDIGEHEIEVTAEGYVPDVQTVRVGAVDKQYTVSVTLQPTQVGLSFVPVVSQKPAVAVFGTNETVYYAIGDEIRNIKTQQLQARFRSSVTGVFPLSGGAAGVSYANGGSVFVPPYGIRPLPPQTTILGASSDGGGLFVLSGKSVSFLSLDAKITRLYDVPAGATIIHAAGDIQQKVGILTSTEGNGYAIYVSRAGGPPVRLLSNIKVPPAVSVNQSASVYFVSTGTDYRAYSFSGQALFTLPNSSGLAGPVAPFREGFLTFERETLDTGQVISRGYYLSVNTKQKTALITDAPISARISVSAPIGSINESTFAVIDGAGGIWILGDLSTLPPSIVSTPPAIPYREPAP
jgi:hypothetical protein